MLKRTRKSPPSPGPGAVKPIEWLRQLTRHGHLSITAQALAAHLFTFADAKDGTRIFPGITRLCDQMSQEGKKTNRKTVVRARDELVDASWLILVCESHGTKANEYRLGIPSGVASTPVNKSSGVPNKLTGVSPTLASGVPNTSSSVGDGTQSDQRTDQKTRASSSSADAEMKSDDDESSGSLSDIIDKLEDNFGTKVVRKLFVPTLVRVKTEHDTSFDEIDSALMCWYHREDLGWESAGDAPGWTPNRNPVGWIERNLARIVSAYLEDQAKVAAELGVSPGDFDLYHYLVEQDSDTPEESQEAA